MRLSNSPETYGLVHQILHWLIALGILGQLVGGQIAHRLPDSSAEEVLFKAWVYSAHKSVGVAILLLVLVRIAWAVAQPHPNLIHGGWEAFAAKTVHWLLYVAMVAVPVFGWIQHAALDGYAPLWWGFGDTLPLVPKSPDVALWFQTAHSISTKALALALVLHIGGALKHALLDRDQTLARMVPGRYRETGRAPAPKGFRASSLAAAGVAIALVGGAIVVANEVRGTGRVAAETAQVATADAEAAADATEQAGQWRIDRERSEVAITVQQLGSDVAGRFDDWNAAVVFDPDDPASASIDATVRTGSISLSDVSERAASAEFLGAQANPTARFRSEEVVATDGGFEARGTLTLAGVERPFALPFTFREENGRAFVEAEGTIQRLDFGVGEGFPDDSSVGRGIALKVTIEATRD